MDRGEVVARGWDLVQADKRLWGIAALIVFSEAAIRLVLLGNTDFFRTIISSVISLLFTAFLNGTLICMIVARLEDRSLTVSEGSREGWRWLLPLFTLGFLLQIPVWGISLVKQGSPTVDTWTLLESPQAAASILLQAFDLLVGLLCSAILVGAERAIILEGQSIVQALRRGRQLLWDHAGDYWGVGIRLFVIVFGIGLAFGFVWVALDLIILRGALSGFLAIISVLGLTIFSGFFAPLEATVWTLAFREWRAQERSELAFAAEQE